MSPKPDYWFPAKRFGWGWGLPVCWQGWVVLVVYIGLVLAVAANFPPHQQTAKFAILVALLTVAFIIICWIKGEPPGWRWGDKDKR